MMDSPRSLSFSSSPARIYLPVRSPSAWKSAAGETKVQRTSLRSRSSARALPCALASGLNASGKSGVSTSCVLCSGSTYSEPAPPTTMRRVSVPERMSARCLSEVECCDRVSGVQAPKASTTASKPLRSSAVRSNRSLMMACWAAVLFSPRTTAVTSKPRSTASLTMSLPALPFAATTAVEVIGVPYCLLAQVRSVARCRSDDRAAKHVSIFLNLCFFLTLLTIARIVTKRNQARESALGTNR